MVLEDTVHLSRARKGLVDKNSQDVCTAEILIIARAKAKQAYCPLGKNGVAHANSLLKQPMAHVDATGPLQVTL